MSANSIYDLASLGTLKESDLVGRDSEILVLNQKYHMTPLSVAVLQGHEEVVKLLLDHGANAKGVPGERLPLYIAAAKTQKKVGGIIELLLEKGADPNDKSVFDNNSTPLLGLVKRYRGESDLDVIEALMNAGADPNMKNDRGQSARSEADIHPNRSVLGLMIPPKVRNLGLIEHLLMFSAIVVFTAAWTNLHSTEAKVITGVVAATTAGAALSGFLGPLAKRFKLDGWFSRLIPESVFQRLKNDNTNNEFETDMHDYITKAHLDRFFQDKEFLQHVVDRAVELKADPATQLNIHDLTRLALYQPVLYCDDSASMVKDQRKEMQVIISERITSLTTCVVPADKGIELRFINRDTESQMSNPSSDTVKSILEATQYDGWTEIGTNFKTKVLEEVVYNPVRAGNLERPVLISILTDGHPQGPSGTKEKRESLKDAVKECGQFLKDHDFEPNVVRFQISQIGYDEESKKFISELASDRSLEDVLYCTSQHLDDEFEQLRKNEHRLDQWILDLLTAPIRNADAR